MLNFWLALISIVLEFYLGEKSTISILSKSICNAILRIRII